MEIWWAKPLAQHPEPSPEYTVSSQELAAVIATERGALRDLGRKTGVIPLGKRDHPLELQPVGEPIGRGFRMLEGFRILRKGVGVSG